MKKHLLEIKRNTNVMDKTDFRNGSLKILCFIFISIFFKSVFANDQCNLKIYTCHPKSQIYLNDSLIGKRNVAIKVFPGAYKITVKNRKDSSAQMILVKKRSAKVHSQVVSPVTFGMGMELSYIFGIFKNAGISITPNINILDRSILGLSIAYHSETALLGAPSAAYFQYYYMFGPFYKNHRICAGAKLGLLLTGIRYPGTNYYMDLGFPDDLNFYYLATSLMYQIGKRPLQFRMITDLFWGTHKYSIFDPYSDPQSTLATRLSFGIYWDL